jgi:hypothetical protein
MVMGALDDVDRIDLHVTEVLYGGRGRERSCAEWGARIEPLRP